MTLDLHNVHFYLYILRSYGEELSFEPWWSRISERGGSESEISDLKKESVLCLNKILSNLSRLLSSINSVQEVRHYKYAFLSPGVSIFDFTAIIFTVSKLNMT